MGGFDKLDNQSAKQTPPSEAQASVRLQVPQENHATIRYQLAAGTLFIPTNHPLPPDTRLTLELEDDENRVIRVGDAVVIAWHTLLKSEETWESPGMRLRAILPEGLLPEAGDTAELSDEDLRDVSEGLAAQIDLDGYQQLIEPVPLPDLQPDALPRLGYRDISEVVATRFDLDSDEGIQRAAPSPRDKRQSTRATIQVPVRTRVLPDGSFFEATAWNLSLGGMFLRTDEPIPPGSELELETQLPGQQVIATLKAKVMRIQPPFDSDEHPRIPGLGLQFIDPPKELLNQIENLVDESQVEEPDMTSPCAVALGSSQIPVEPTMDLPTAAHKRMVVNALVTALDISGIKEFVGNETLRYLLDVWYLKYHQAGVVDLTLLWNTLAADQSIDSIQAALPLYIFALNRHEHGLEVKLPESLSRFDECSKTLCMARKRLKEVGSFRQAYDQVAKRAAVSDRKRTDRQIRQHKTKKKALKPWPRSKTGPAKTPRRQQVKVPSHSRRRTMLLAAGLLLAPLALWLNLPSRTSTFDPSEVSGILVLERALAQGNRLQATITDPRWFEMKEEDQRATVQKLIERLDLQGIRSALLFDADQMLAASARLTENGTPVIKIGQEVLMEPQSRR